MAASAREENRVPGLVATSNVSATTPVVLWADPSTHALLVTTSGGGSTQDVNLVSISGTAITLGQKTMTSSLPVTIASNQGALSVTQGTSPWIVAGGGTAGSAATGVVTVQGIASMTPVQVSQATASNLNAQVVGNIAHDSADSGNPIKIGGFGNSTAPTGITDGDRVNAWFGINGTQVITPYMGSSSAGADGANQGLMMSPAGGSVALPFGGAGYVFNSATWDRSRSVVNATNSTGTGITAVGNLAQFDDAAPTSITENQFGNLRMSANRNAYTTIRDAAGNERGVNVTAGNALVVDGSGSTQPISGSVTVTQATASNLNAQVVGSVASGSADSGNPVKIGGVYNSTLPTFTNGQRADLQIGSRGSLRVELFNTGSTQEAVVALPTDPNSTFVGLFTSSQNLNYNGSTWNFARSVVNATNSTGTGITAVGNLAQFDDVAPTAITENQFGNLRMSANRNLYGTIRDAAGNERGANVSAGNALLVDASATTQPVSYATTGSGTATGALRVELANNGTGVLATVGTVTTVSTVTAVTAISTSVTPGTSAAHLGKAEDAVAGAGDTGVAVWGVANEAQTSLAADGDYIGQATDIKGNRMVVGNIAHDGADAGNPVKIGAKAVNAEPAPVSATNDRANLISDLVGKLIVLPYSNPENFVSGVTSAMTGTTSTSLVAAPAAGLRNYITHIIVTNSHATVGTFVLIQDGSGGTTIYEGYCAAAGGGFSISFPTPLRQPTTATALYVQNVTTGANTIAAASGYKGA